MVHGEGHCARPCGEHDEYGEEDYVKLGHCGCGKRRVVQ
jgi:hypothetical protein